MEEDEDKGQRDSGGFWAMLARDPEVILYFGLAIMVASWGISMIVEAFSR